jgi:hypothetical protein
VFIAPPLDEFPDKLQKLKQVGDQNKFFYRHWLPPMSNRKDGFLERYRTSGVCCAQGDRTMPGHTIPTWVTIASSLSVGSFVGSLITLYFSSKQRRQEWIKDNKKQEWRELISTLSQSFHYITNNSFGMMSGEQEKGCMEADAEARRSIESRIFVWHRIQSENVRERWQLLATEKDWGKMIQYWNELHATLIATAHKDCGIGQ